MRIWNNSCPDEITFSLLIDGALSNETSRQVYEHIEECKICHSIYQEISTTSALVRETCSLQLSSEEIHTFHTTLEKQLLESKPIRRESWIERSRFIQSLRSGNWQWKIAMALLLALLSTIPFLPETNQNSSEYFLPPLASDFSDATITLETDPNAGFDLIWVVTGEDEVEESSISPLGYHPIIII